LTERSKFLRRIRELAEPVLREYSDLRYAWNQKIMGPLIEASLDLGAARVSEASPVADRAADGLQFLKPPLTGQEHFLSGAVNALYYATGRPAGDGSPTDPPGSGSGPRARSRSPGRRIEWGKEDRLKRRWSMISSGAALSCNSC
jgi:hypothetical protein